MAASRFRFHPAAEAEFDAAADWYEEQGTGLGREFVAAVRAKVDMILAAPQRWRVVAGTRRTLLARFPYAVVYREVTDDEIEIVAVAHFKRHPTYWSRR